MDSFFLMEELLAIPHSTPQTQLVSSGVLPVGRYLVSIGELSLLAIERHYPNPSQFAIMLHALKANVEQQARQMGYQDYSGKGRDASDSMTAILESNEFSQRRTTATQLIEIMRVKRMLPQQVGAGKFVEMLGTYGALCGAEVWGHRQNTRISN